MFAARRQISPNKASKDLSFSRETPEKKRVYRSNSSANTNQRSLLKSKRDISQDSKYKKAKDARYLRKKSTERRISTPMDSIEKQIQQKSYELLLIEKEKMRLLNIESGHSQIMNKIV
jgi:deoxycytidine triphosphate deaminase